MNTDSRVLRKCRMNQTSGHRGNSDEEEWRSDRERER